MEIDARTIREVEFREKIRGYNPDDVDDFLEQVAIAFESMQERMSGPLTSGQMATQVPAVGIETKEIRTGSSVVSTPIDKVRAQGFRPEFDDDTIQRTLLLAQKTADATLKNAEEEAESTVKEARSKADVLLSQAQQRAREIVDEAITQARDEVLDLAKSKDKLVSELNQLTARVASAKGEMKSLLEGVLQQIDGSFATFATKSDLVEPTGLPKSDLSDRQNPIDSSSRSGLFGEPNSGNGLGVYDDELE